MEFTLFFYDEKEPRKEAYLRGCFVIVRILMMLIILKIGRVLYV